MDTQTNRQKLIDALRSGKYKKGVYSMKKSTSYFNFDIDIKHCPLGVACEVYHAENPTKSKWIVNKPQRIHTFFVGSYINSSSTFPPGSVIDFFGMTPGDMRIIADLNDYKDATFDDIAEYIEGYDK